MWRHHAVVYINRSQSLHQINDLYSTRTVLAARIAGHTGPCRQIHELFGTGTHCKLAQDTARTIGQNLIPGAYTGTGTALQAGHESFADMYQNVFDSDL